MENKCAQCAEMFKRNYVKQKFCSHQCYSKNKIGSKHDWGNKISQSLTGKAKTPEHIVAMSKCRVGKKRPCVQNEKHPLWRGDAVGYDALHDWVERRKGKPRVCVDCGTRKRRLAWSNDSGMYLRDLSDWSARCRKCHYEHDQHSPAVAFQYVGNGKMQRVL